MFLSVNYGVSKTRISAEATRTVGAEKRKQSEWEVGGQEAALMHSGAGNEGTETTCVPQRRRTATEASPGASETEEDKSLSRVVSLSDGQRAVNSLFGPSAASNPRGRPDSRVHSKSGALLPGGSFV